MIDKKLDADAFHAQFHNHEKHLTDQEHEYVPADVAHPTKTPSRHPHPDYRSKKKHKHRAVDKALSLTAGM
jgi:hypothetical protein